MDTIPGSMVRLNVPEWYEEPEFQAWFNRQLGRGLATWQPAKQPLFNSMASTAECEDMLQRLREHVVYADVLFEPCDVGDAELMASENARLDAANATLEKLSSQLEKGAREGLRGEIILKLANKLFEDVISADVLFEPVSAQDFEIYQGEVRRLNMAQSTLDQIALRLHDIGERAECEDSHAYADCFVGVDPGFNGEGTDSDMPEKYWDVVVEEAKKACVGSPDVHVMVWLSPVA
jgi:hypothetical protein